jgi:hypothetical protein
MPKCQPPGRRSRAAADLQRRLLAGNAAEDSRNPVGNQAPNRPPANRRRPAPLLPKDYAGLRELLRTKPWLRSELVDAGLEARGRAGWFTWRDRKFRIKVTGLGFEVTDGRHRPLVRRWH